MSVQIRHPPRVLRLGIASAIADGEEVDLSGLPQTERESIRMQVKKLRRARRAEAKARVQ